jgi:hypothetical protein
MYRGWIGIMDLRSWENSQGISQGINRCLPSMAVLLTKLGIAEGCAAGRMLGHKIKSHVWGYVMTR